MDLLKKVNVFMSILVLGYIAYYILLDGIMLPTIAILAFLALMMLLMGIEDVKVKKNKWGYFYLFSSSVMFLGAANELFNIF